MKALQQMGRPTLDYPAMPSKKEYKAEDGNEDPVAFKMTVFAWKEEYKAMRVRKDRYRDKESNAWAIIYDQCSPELKNKLEGAEGYEKAKETNDIIQLLKMIHNYCCQFNTLNDEYVSIGGTFKNLFFFWQKARPNQHRLPQRFYGVGEGDQRIWRTRIHHALSKHDKERAQIKESWY